MNCKKRPSISTYAYVNSYGYITIDRVEKLIIFFYFTYMSKIKKHEKEKKKITNKNYLKKYLFIYEQNK